MTVDHRLPARAAALVCAPVPYPPRRRAHVRSLAEKDAGSGRTLRVHELVVHASTYLDTRACCPDVLQLALSGSLQPPVHRSESDNV